MISSQILVTQPVTREVAGVRKVGKPDRGAPRGTFAGRRNRAFMLRRQR